MTLPRIATIAFVVFFGGCNAAAPATTPEAGATTKPSQSDDGIPWSEPIVEPKNPPVQAPAPTTPTTQTTPLAPGEVALRYPRSETPWLGVELEATEAEAPGVKLTRVVEGSPAAKAHLQPGDVLLKMGETPALAPSEVQNWVRSQVPGSQHPFMILRGGNQKLVRVDLEGAPEFEDRLRLALVGRTAPEIAGVATFQGEASSLRELRGQVVVLEFWASYCGVCRVIAPILDEWHRTYKPQGGHVFGITVDPPALGLRVALKTGMNYTLASDNGGEISQNYLASQIPAIIIIDRQGIVRDAMVGYSRTRFQETESLIEDLLKDAP